MKKNFFPLSFFLMLLYLCSCNNSNTAQTQSQARKQTEIKSIFVNGDSIHYIDIGKGDPVVFVHGAFGDFRTWETQLDTFAQHHRVISYSRRRSYPNNQSDNDSTDVTNNAHAKDLAELLKALNLGPAHVVGHSSGGSIALLTTMEHPEMVRSLVLAEGVVPSLLKNVPHGDSVLNSFFVNPIKPATEAFKANDDEKGVSIFINGVMGDSLCFKNLPPNIRNHMITNVAETKQNILHPKPSTEVTCNDLNKIKVPVLLLSGEKSISFFHLMNDELYRCLSNRERAIILKAAHGLENENPAAFNKVVLTFIDKN